MKYEIILENEEDGRFSAHVPSLPGCHSWGENREETITNIKEAIEGYLEVLKSRMSEYRKTGESVAVENMRQDDSLKENGVGESSLESGFSC